jgi:DNA-binding winged helix-turn-helix (wHTH) protein/predicted ATPase/class 3 adenylate cyclase
MMRYVFGDYTLDTEHYELRHREKRVRLEPRVFNLLTTLVQHPGQTLTKEELWAQVWPQLPILSDQSLKKCVEQARKALGEAGKTPRYIETVRGRGYRFIAAVDVRQGTEREAPGPPVTPRPAAQPERDHADAGAAPVPLVPAPPPTAPLVLTPVPLPEVATAETRGAVTQVPPEDEWRQLTVLVCHLGEVSGPAAPRDRDAREARLADVREYQALCAEVVQRFEGHIAQYQVERLIVHFGYPQAHEDDARRAVHTGLEIVEGMAELNRRRKQDRRHGSDVRLTVQVGIHTGLELIGAMAHGAQRPALAVGETVTIATGLQRHAGTDTVLISPVTWRLVEGYFVCESLGAQVLDDLAQPLAVYRVRQASTAQSRLDVAGIKGLTPFVGREQEVGLLGERWQQAREGMGQVVILSGDAGIGKSRLVQILIESMAAEAHVRVEYHCSPYYQHTALYPVVTFLQRLLQFRPEDPPEERLHKLELLLERYSLPLEEGIPLAAALLSLPLPERYPPLQMTPQRQKQKTLELLLAWWLKEAERQPLCVIMEDLHWADASTLELLTRLIEQVPTARILLLLLCRPEFHPPWASRFYSYLTQVALGRLSRQQVETMVERITGGKALPTELLQELVAKTDGVPLFVEELTKMVLESGLVKERKGQYVLVDPLPPLAIPDTLHDSLMARLDRLGLAKQVAQLGATIGREFSYAVLQAVSPLDEITLQKELAQLVDAELLYQRGLFLQTQYRFKHALIQEVAYQSMLRNTRRQYHRQIAQVLEAQFPEMIEIHPELLAYHYTEAGQSAQAIPYWQRAGERAIERSANIEAISHLTKGLEVLRTLPETPESNQHELSLQLALGAPLLMLKGSTAPEVEHAYTRAYELSQQVEESPQRFSALVGLWRFYLSRSGLQKAYEIGEQCFTLAQHSQDLALLQEAHMMLGATLLYLGKLVSARIHLEQGIALYDPQRCRSWVFSSGNDPGVVCLSWASWMLWLLGYPDQALNRIQEAITLAQKLSLPYSLGYALFYAAALHRCRREAQLVQEQARAMIALSNQQGFIRWMVLGTGLQGWALAELGSVEEGIVQLRQGLSTWRTIGGAQALGLPHFLAMLAEAYGTGGRAAEGLHVVTEALAIVHEYGERHYEAELYRLKGELLLQLAVGRDSACTAPLELPIVAEAKRGGATHVSSLQTEAETCFQQALIIARHQQAKSWELRAAMSLARLWQQQGKHAEAHQILTESYSWFTEGFDTPDLQEAKALLEALT